MHLPLQFSIIDIEVPAYTCSLFPLLSNKEYVLVVRRVNAMSQTVRFGVIYRSGDSLFLSKTNVHDFSLL